MYRKLLLCPKCRGGTQYIVKDGDCICKECRSKNGVTLQKAIGKM